MKKIFFVLFNLLIVFLIFNSNLPKVLASDYLLFDFRSNNDPKIKWEVGFTYIGGYNQASSHVHSMFRVITDESCSGWSWCKRTPGASSYLLDGHRPYGIQWGTSCVDPKQKLTFVDTSSPGADYYSTGIIDITAPNTAGLQAYPGGTIPFGSSFSDTSNCPTCTNQCNEGARQCSGNTAQVCQRTSCGTKWVTDQTCTSSCDNNTGQCRHRGCSSEACVWLNGNGSDSCTTSSECSVTKYSCSSTGACVVNSNGAYTTSSCGGNCCSQASCTSSTQGNDCNNGTKGGTFTCNSGYSCRINPTNNDDAGCYQDSTGPTPTPPSTCSGHSHYACTSTNPAPNGTCCDFTYRLENGACVARCHAGVNPSLCPGGTCGNPATPTSPPQSTPTPTPPGGCNGLICAICVGNQCGSYCETNASSCGNTNCANCGTSC